LDLWEVLGPTPALEPHHEILAWRAGLLGLSNGAAAAVAEALKIFGTTDDDECSGICAGTDLECQPHLQQPFGAKELAQFRAWIDAGGDDGQDAIVLVAPPTKTVAPAGRTWAVAAAAALGPGLTFNMDAADALATLSHASLEVATHNVAALAALATLAQHPGALFDHIARATASRAFAPRRGTIAYACAMIQSVGFVREVHCRAGLDEQVNLPGEVELAKALGGFASRILTATKQVAVH